MNYPLNTYPAREVFIDDVTFKTLIERLSGLDTTAPDIEAIVAETIHWAGIYPASVEREIEREERLAA